MTIIIKNTTKTPLPSVIRSIEGIYPLSTSHHLQASDKADPHFYLCNSCFVFFWMLHTLPVVETDMTDDMTDDTSLRSPSSMATTAAVKSVSFGFIIKHGMNHSECMKCVGRNYLLC